MGNPHAVIYADELTDELVLRSGAVIESHPLFPKRTNVEFVRILSESEIRMRVYERGCGETMACGTGACAGVVSGVLNKRHGNAVTVHLPGGDLRIDSLALEKSSGMIYGGTWEGGHLFRLDPHAMTVELIGTPHRGPRLPALKFSKAGILYGAAGGGFQYKTRPAFLFSYDPASRELTEIGDIVAQDSGIRGQRMHTMAMGKDGRIYLGETGMMTGEAGEVGLNPYVFVCRVEG
jgi:hypothetical protein